MLAEIGCILGISYSFSGSISCQGWLGRTRRECMAYSVLSGVRDG